MKTTFITPRLFAALLAAVLLARSGTGAAELHVMTSGAFTAAYKELIPEFERTTGHVVHSTFGASMGNTPDAIPNRLQRGEPADVVILAASALEGLIRDARVIGGSRVDLVRSRIGMAVRAGASKPDISTVPALKRTLLAAKSIAFSSSASGVYLLTELFPRLEIAGQVAAKSRRVEGEMVGSVIARGEVELGFQQMSELLPIAGIVIVGPLPAEAQKITVFSAGIATVAREPTAAQALLRFLSSPSVGPVIRRTGLEPCSDP